MDSLDREIFEVARRVRAARAYAGLSIQELAARVGIGLQTLKRIENGRRKPSGPELLAIAEACGLPREFFDLDLDLLSNRALLLQRTMSQVDRRLSRIEQKLGLEAKRQSGEARGPGSARSSARD